MLSSVTPFIAAELTYRYERDREYFAHARAGRLSRKQARAQRLAKAAKASPSRRVTVQPR
jgi:hypothetical protein